MNKNIIILGFGLGWGDFLTDSELEKKEIWAMNKTSWDIPVPQNLKKLFAMDGLNGLTRVTDGYKTREDLVREVNILTNLTGLEFIGPLKEEGVDNAKAFPIKEVVEKFDVRYFKSTMAYMLAYAALNKVETIDLYGCNLAGSQEFFIEKPCVEFWMGVCLGQGIKMTVHGEQSFLLRQKVRWGDQMLYGYEMNFEEL